MCLFFFSVFLSSACSLISVYAPIHWLWSQLQKHTWKEKEKKKKPFSGTRRPDYYTLDLVLHNSRRSGGLREIWKYRDDVQNDNKKKMKKSAKLQRRLLVFQKRGAECLCDSFFNVTSLLIDSDRTKHVKAIAALSCCISRRTVWCHVCLRLCTTLKDNAILNDLRANIYHRNII